MKTIKASKVPSVNPDSPFWHPVEMGDTLKGKYKGFQETALSPCIIIGDKLVSASKVILNQLRPHYTQLREGKSEIVLIYTGLGKKKIKGNFPRLFAVYLDGKKLNPVFENEKMSKAAVASLFTNSKTEK